MGKALGWTAGLLTILLAGCNSAPPASPGTGADAVVREYYDALMRKDWNEAYAALHAESRTKVSAAQFAQQADGYRRRLGFEPQQVVVRSCEEHGTEALAHIVAEGRSTVVQGRSRVTAAGLAMACCASAAVWRSTLAATSDPKCICTLAAVAHCPMRISCPITPGRILSVTRIHQRRRHSSRLLWLWDVIGQ